MKVFTTVAAVTVENLEISFGTLFNMEDKRFAHTDEDKIEKYFDPI